MPAPSFTIRASERMLTFVKIDLKELFESNCGICIEYYLTIAEGRALSEISYVVFCRMRLEFRLWFYRALNCVI